jgi:Glycosyl transferase family 11
MRQNYETNECSIPSEVFMVIVRIKAGLGNQMFQYAVGRSLALQKGTDLVMDNGLYEIDTFRKFELARFKISGKFLSRPRRMLEEQLQRRKLKPLRSVLETIRFPLVPTYIQDLQKGFDRRPEESDRDLYLDGFWQSEQYFKSIRDLLLKDFTFKEDPDPENSRMLSCIDSSNAVCVHIRRGDYVSTASGRERHGVCSMDYYCSALDHIRQRTVDPVFFIFSDDPEWVVSDFPKIESATIVSHNVGRNDIEDMRLMMRCRHFIIANSTFSWWAAWLSRHPGKIVIAPKVWYASPTLSDADLVPENWVRL